MIITVNELIVLGFGASGAFIVSILYFYIKRLKKKLKKYVLRFEQIKDKFD